MKDEFESFKTIFDNAPIGIIRTNTKGEILMVNKQMARLAGYKTVDEFNGNVKNVVDLYAEAYARDEFLTKLKNENEVVFETKIKQPNAGLVRIAEVFAQAEKDDKGNILHITSMAHDISEKLELEKKAQQSTRFINSILSAIPVEMWVISEDNKVLLQSKYSQNKWGNLEGKNANEFQHNVKTSVEEAPLMLKAKNGEIVDVEYDVEALGKKYHTRRIMGPVPDNNEGKGFVSISFDITKQKKAERELIEKQIQLEKLVEKLELSEAGYKKFIKHSPVAIMKVRYNKPVPLSIGVEEQIDWFLEHSYIEEMNEAYAKSFNSTPADLIGKPTHTMWKDKIEIRKVIRDMVTSDYTWINVESEEIKKDGSKVFFLNGLFSTERTDKIYSFWVFAIDITELKNTQNELRKHKENLELLVQERTNEIQQLNEELQANNEELYTTNEMLVEERNRLEEALEELKLIQGQLIKQEKMASIGTLTAGIAHEINNPVNFISSGITGIKFMIEEMTQITNQFIDVCIEVNDCPAKKKIDTPGIKEKMTEILDELPILIESINNGVERTTNIVKGLRTFSRLDTENLVQANINELIDSTLTILYNKYKDRIEIIKDFSDIPKIYCLPGKLGQVFLNVLVNAIQAIENKGKIYIHTGLNLQKNNIVIKIKDNGPGIPQKVVDKIFDPFFTTKDVGEGTGLGLSIVHGIIEEHNGIIEVNSKKGNGTEFIMFLPLKSNAGS